MNNPSTLSTSSVSTKFKTWEQAVEWLRNEPDQQELVRAAYYDDPLFDAAARYWKSEEWRELRNFLPTKKGKALDIGAGRGIASYALAKDGFEVMALEPDPSSLVGAKAIKVLIEQTQLPISVMENYSETLPIKDNHYDIVFVRAVLHHTSDLEQACREYYRVLKPGGHFIAAREHVISHPKDLERFLEIHPLHKLYGGENAFLLEQYRSAIKNAGFEIEAVITPLESAINFAPHTLETLKHEISTRLSKNIPLIKTICSTLLSYHLTWRLVLPVLTKLDNRPGRLYSFIAKKA